MSAKHAFSQDEISKHIDIAIADRQWEHFINVVETLGYSVKITGGNFLTHQINCSSQDYQIILELL